MATEAKRTYHYGPGASQAGDLYLPETSPRRVVCLLHGGFWRVPFGRAEMIPIARDLVAHGYAVWNLEYRRMGEPGGGWPGTLQDVGAGIDHLATLVTEGLDVDLERVVVAGHSAGGQLALWSAARPRARRDEFGPRRVRPYAAAGLAPVADLARAHELSVGRSAVAELLDGSPRERPERYANASPIARLPLGARQLVIHGTADDTLPIEISRRYVKAAAEVGDEVRFVEVDGGGHMDFLDPASVAHGIFRDWLAAI